MKKFLFAASLGFLALSAKAQTAAVQYQADAAVPYPLAIALVGNSDPDPICHSNESTILYAIPVSPTPAATTVGATAVPMHTDKVVTLVVDVQIGLSHYGGQIELCGLTDPSKDNPISFGGGIYDCLYDIVSISPTLVAIYFHP
jgi:hypothetical protein